MKLSEYQRSRSFFNLVKGHSDFKVKLFDFGRYTQVSDPGPHGPLVFDIVSTRGACLKCLVIYAD